VSEHFASLSDAAKATGVPLRTVSRWASQGRLTCEWPEGINGRTFVSVYEVDELASLRDTHGRLPRLPRAS
jgi:hypothetical protein